MRMFLNLERYENKRLAALDDAGHEITYGELVENAKHFEMPMLKRSVVFFLAHNSVASLNAYYSMVENDIIPVMLSQDINATLLQTLIDTYQPPYICALDDKASNLPYEKVISTCGCTYLATGFAPYPVNDKLQLLMTTSGSTGSPKLVRYKKGNLEANAANVALAFDWTEKERPICDLAMNYTMGLNVVNTHLYVGATLLLVASNITSGEYWKFIKENEGTNFTGVPFSYELLTRLRFFRMDIPSLTTMSEGGGRLTDKMFRDFAQFAADHGKRFIASFGTTETAARLSVLPPNRALDKIGSIGKAIPGGRMVIMDDAGKEIETTEAEGELGYYGPNVTMGYATEKGDLMKDDEFNGFYKTGDIAKRDAEGFYYIVGRKSRFLKLLGYRVSLDQCERLIKAEFKVDCACGGTDKQMLIFVTSAQIVEEVKNFIADKTGLFKTLFKVIAVDEIPRNRNGKVAYKQLESLTE